MNMQQVTEQTETPEGSPASCVHFWLIDPANGPFSDGTCRNCEEHRTFKNNLDTFDYNPYASQSAPDVGRGEPSDEDPPGYF